MSRSSVSVTAIVVLAMLGLIGCADRRPAAAAPEAAPAGSAPVAPVPEKNIGLALGRLEELPPLAPTPALPGEPGEAPVQPAPYVGSPPIVPHAVDDFTPIARDENMCLGCHLVEEKVEGEATPIPASHFVDLRNAPGVQGEDIAGARWACLACHVAPTDASPLVRNDF